MEKKFKGKNISIFTDFNKFMLKVLNNMYLTCTQLGAI